LIQVDKNDKHLGGVDGDADVLELLAKSEGLGSGQRRKRMKIGNDLFSQELEK
jgi:hypothetical protein